MGRWCKKCRVRRSGIDWMCQKGKFSFDIPKDVLIMLDKKESSMTKKKSRVGRNPLCDRCWYPKARANQLVGFCKRCKERLTKPARKGNV